MWMSFKKIIKMFENGNVSVCGLRGSGKDMLMANVIARRNKPYVSNVPYGGERYPLDFDKIDCGKNTWQDFLSGAVSPYDYPYPIGSDIYLSDAGVYLPSQFCGEINKKYPYIATFQALSRHVGRCNFHTNAQSLGRVYDKIREQSDQYVMANKCKVLFGGKLVIQWVTIYDKYQSAVDRVRPCRVRMPFLCLNPERRERIQMYLDDFYNKHGTVKKVMLVYINKSSYDTHYFGTLLSQKGLALGSD